MRKVDPGLLPKGTSSGSRRGEGTQFDRVTTDRSSTDGGSPGGVLDLMRSALAKVVSESESKGFDQMSRESEPSELLVGVSKAIAFHAHPIHDRQIHAAQFSFVIVFTGVIQNATCFKSARQATGQ